MNIFFSSQLGSIPAHFKHKREIDLNKAFISGSRWLNNRFCKSSEIPYYSLSSLWITEVLKLPREDRILMELQQRYSQLKKRLFDLFITLNLSFFDKKLWNTEITRI